MFRHDLLEGSGAGLRERWRPLRERLAALVEGLVRRHLA